MTLLLPFGPLHGVNSTLAKQAAAFLVDLESAELYDFAVSLGIGPGAAEPIWRDFVEDGYIMRNPAGRWVPSERMKQLQTARFGRPLPRKKAETLLRQTIVNAQAVNAEPPDAELFYVTKVAVFGSYLDPSRHELGDLDLAYELELRPGVERFDHHCIIYNKDSTAPTRARLRTSPLVRLATMGNLLALECPYQLVYEFHSPVIDQVRAERQAARAALASQQELDSSRT